MSKELTEQWKNKTIDTSRHYYVRIVGKKDMGCDGIDFIDIVRPPLFADSEDKLWKYNNPDVLCEVPSYEELQKLKERIADAEHILDEMGCADRGLIDDYFEKWGVK